MATQAVDDHDADIVTGNRVIRTGAADALKHWASAWEKQRL